MNKKIVKVFSILLMVIMLCSISLSVFAADKSAFTPSSITGESSSVETENISTIGNNVVKILQTVGIVLSVIILSVLGIKYMMGSAEEKADYKKSMIPYIIGAALIFAASALAQVVYDFFGNF